MICSSTVLCGLEFLHCPLHLRGGDSSRLLDNPQNFQSNHTNLQNFSKFLKISQNYSPHFSPTVTTHSDMEEAINSLATMAESALPASVDPGLEDQLTLHGVPGWWRRDVNIITAIVRSLIPRCQPTMLCKPEFLVEATINTAIIERFVAVLNSLRGTPRVPKGKRAWSPAQLWLLCREALRDRGHHLGRDIRSMFFAYFLFATITRNTYMEQFQSRPTFFTRSTAAHQHTRIVEPVLTSLQILQDVSVTLAVALSKVLCRWRQNMG